MTSRSHLLGVALCALALSGQTASAQTWGVTNSPPQERVRPRSFAQTIADVVAMPQNNTLQNEAHRYGLNIVNVMWEDTGRYQGSSVGPNISDVTLQVREPERCRASGPGGDQQTCTSRTHLLPVIRFPNFSDRTADIAAEKLWVRVGNHIRGGQLHSVPLSEVLSNLHSYISRPEQLRGTGNLSAARDTHFLVSAQHVFVPIRSQGTAEFNPVLYNYQSSPSNPAVMVLLVTRQGMSATVIENRPGDQSMQGWGQQLFFDNAGRRTMFTAERRSAVAARIERGEGRAQDEGALEEGADMMMLVQIPLRHRQRSYNEEPLGGIGGGGMASGSMADAENAPAAAAPSAPRRSRVAETSDVENAVIGHGRDRGNFRGMNNLELVRDDRFPVRVTIQFYRATSNGVVSPADMQQAYQQIERVYADGDFVGSLVVPTNNRTRPTDWVQIREGFCAHRRCR